MCKVWCWRWLFGNEIPISLVTHRNVDHHTTPIVTGIGQPLCLNPYTSTLNPDYSPLDPGLWTLDSKFEASDPKPLSHTLNPNTGGPTCLETSC